MQVDEAVQSVALHVGLMHILQVGEAISGSLHIGLLSYFLFNDRNSTSTIPVNMQVLTTFIHFQCIKNILWFSWMTWLLYSN